jgi:hypothetical protein
MAALSGILTDYNSGSQVRTMSEAFGSVIEQQGVWSQALAFQALTYGAMSLFNIAPSGAIAASGTVLFSTSASGSPPPASQNVPISQGTLVQTNGGVQFQTTAPATLSSGVGSISIPIAAVIPGAAGNVPVSGITQIVTGLIYPLFVSNSAPTTGGADAQSASSALALFAATIASIGLSSPVAIANAAIGVTFGAESVQYSTLLEPWVYNPAFSGLAYWQLYIDNGTGTASSGLVHAVDLKLNGGTVSGVSNAGGAIGYRDAGVPYDIFAVSGTPAVVGVSGTAVSGTDTGLLTLAVQQAVSGYFALPFGAPAEQANIAAVVANAGAGQFTALAVALYASGSSSGIPTLSVSPSGRVILGQINTQIV